MQKDLVFFKKEGEETAEDVMVALMLAATMKKESKED